MEWESSSLSTSIVVWLESWLTDKMNFSDTHSDTPVLLYHKKYLFLEFLLDLKLAKLSSIILGCVFVPFHIVGAVLSVQAIILR